MVHISEMGTGRVNLEDFPDGSEIDVKLLEVRQQTVHGLALPVAAHVAKTWGAALRLRRISHAPNCYVPRSVYKAVSLSLAHCLILDCCAECKRPDTPEPAGGAAGRQGSSGRLQHILRSLRHVRRQQWLVDLAHHRGSCAEHRRQVGVRARAKRVL